MTWENHHSSWGVWFRSWPLAFLYMKDVSTCKYVYVCVCCVYVCMCVLI